jgi:hypothetical protein
VYVRPGLASESDEDDSEVDMSSLVKPKSNGAMAAEMVQANIGAMVARIPFEDLIYDA